MSVSNCHEIEELPGPDPFKPEKPVASKRESEKALMASIVDMSRSTQAQCIQDLEEHGAHVRVSLFYLPDLSLV